MKTKEIIWWILLLVVIDQATKIVIYHFYMDTHFGIIHFPQKPIKKNKAPRHRHYLSNRGTDLCFARQYRLEKGGIGFHLSQAPIYFRSEGFIQ